MIKCNLAKNDIVSFRKNGFLIKENFLDENLTTILKSKFLGLFSGKFETGIEPDEWNWIFGVSDNSSTRQICNAWKSDNLIKKIVCHEKIGEIISNLMGWSGTRIIQDNILWKPPQAKPVGYHQDAAYDDWIIPQTMASCWISLDKTTKNSGTLEYVIGSHKWGLQPPKNNFHSPEDYKKHLISFAKKHKKEIEIQYVEVPKGGVAFHHGLIWHGSGINVSKKNRRSIVSHCIPENSKFHPTNTGGTARIYKKYMKINSLELEESFFPIIWSNRGYKTFKKKS